MELFEYGENPKEIEEKTTINHKVLNAHDVVELSFVLNHPTFNDDQFYWYEPTLRDLLMAGI